MSSYSPGPGGSGVGRRFEETIDKIEAELRQAIGHVNDSIVPHVRKESIAAMRKMAVTLQNLADRFEKAPQPPSQAKDPES